MDPFLAGALLLFAVMLSPSLRSGYRADDTWTSEFQGALDLNGENVFLEMLRSAQKFWESGRPNPLAALQGLSASWLLNDHRVLYHVMLIASTLVAAWALYSLVRLLGLTRAAGALVVVLVAGAVQFRSFHDASLGYWGTTQFVLALTLASLAMFQRYLVDGRPHTLVVSFLLFLPCPMLYEGAYPFVLLHLGLALFERRGRRAWLAVAPFLGLAALFAGLSLYARAASSGVVGGYEVGSSPLAAARTYILQLFTPFPGSSLFFNADFASFMPLGGQPTPAELLGGAWRGGAVFVVVVAVALVSAGRDGKGLPSGGALGRISVVGILLWTTSVLAISVAPKYQFELVAGKGHLPALTQVFGWGLMAAAAVFALMTIASRRSRTAMRVTAVGCGAFLGLGAAVCGYINLRVVALEYPIVQSRDLLEDSAQRGVLADVPDGSTLLTTTRDLGWPTGSLAQSPGAATALLRDRSGRTYEVRSIAPAVECEKADPAVNTECARLTGSAAWMRVRTRPGGGSVIVGATQGANPTTAKARSLRVLAQGDGAQVPPPRLIGLTARDKPWSSDDLEWQRVDGDEDWTIYTAAFPPGAELPVAATLDDAAAAIDYTGMGLPGRIVRVYGTKHLLP